MNEDLSTRDPGTTLVTLHPTESGLYSGVTLSSISHTGATLSSSTLSSVTTSSNECVPQKSSMPTYHAYSTASQANVLLQKMRSLRRPLVNTAFPQTPSYHQANQESRLNPLLETSPQSNDNEVTKSQEKDSSPQDISKPTNSDSTKGVSPGTAAIAELQALEQEWQLCIQSETGSKLMRKAVESNNRPDVWIEFLEWQLSRKCMALFDEKSNVISRSDLNFLEFVYSKVVEVISPENRSKDNTYVHIWLQYIWILRQKNGDMDEIRNIFKHLKSFSVAPQIFQFYIHWADFERVLGHIDKASTILSNGLRLLNDGTSELELALDKLKRNRGISLLEPISYDLNRSNANQPGSNEPVEVLKHMHQSPEKILASCEPALGDAGIPNQIPSNNVPSENISSPEKANEEPMVQTAPLPVDLTNQRTSDDAVTSLSGRRGKKFLVTNFRKMGLIPRRMSAADDSTREMTLEMSPESPEKPKLSQLEEAAPFDEEEIKQEAPIDERRSSEAENPPGIQNFGHGNLGNEPADLARPSHLNPSKPIYNEIQAPLKDSPPADSKPTSNEHRIVTEIVKVNGVPYSRLELIGKGGSSKVYKIMATQGKILAMKRVKLDGADEAMIFSYKNEITLLNRLKGCDSIIKLYDSEIDQANGYITMIMEYGEIDLAKLLHRQQGKAINENFIRLYWQQMLEAVHAIHEERIVHSDLKPANFLVVEGSLKLIDFGIAKAIQNDTTNIVRESQVGDPRLYLFHRMQTINHSLMFF
jgi:tRNA A-37 threonylcarbamoyl transferase component Bud32